MIRMREGDGEYQYTAEHITETNTAKLTGNMKDAADAACAENYISQVIRDALIKSAREKLKRKNPAPENAKQDGNSYTQDPKLFKSAIRYTAAATTSPLDSEVTISNRNQSRRISLYPR